MSFLLFLVVCLGLTNAVNLPAGLTVCQRSSATYEDCVKKSIESFFETFKDGNKDLGLNRLDPLTIKVLNLEGAGSVSVNQYYKDVKLYGLIGSTVEEFKINLEDKCMIDIETLSPVIYISGKYRATGQVLLFAINAEGKSNHTLSHLKMTHKITCEKYKKDGEEYIKVLDYKATIKPESIVFFFDNLVPGNEAISTEILNTLNENSLSVFEEVRELQEVSFGLVFKQLANNIFQKIPHTQLFPK